MEQNAALVEQFLDAMWMERGLSENTLASYRNDLVKLCQWLDKDGEALVKVSSSKLQDYQHWLFEQDYKQSSRARMLSAMRRLFQYLYREKQREDDPTATLISLNCPNACRKICQKSRWMHCWKRRM